MAIQKIDEIMAKDPTERTAEEIEYMINWQVEKRFEAAQIAKAEEERKQLHQEIMANEEKLLEHHLAALERLESAAMASAAKLG